MSLFAGIGGIDLAAGWAGFRTILFVEIDLFCRKVLNKHWPGVPIIGDIKDVTKEVIANATSQRPHNQENEQEMEGKGCNQLHIEQPRVNGAERNRTTTIPPVTLITGGFPCQPVSHAGKRGGKADDRWLWPEMLRVISEVRPTWVVAENVTGLLTMGFYDCLSDLEGEGYETIPFVIPACAVNAPHRRDRIFIVGYAKKLHQYAGDNQRAEGKAQVPESRNSGGETDVADTPQPGLEGSARAELLEQCQRFAGSDRWKGEDWWAVEPDVGRVAYGIPSRVDRLKALGNAVVPQQIYPILKAIADIELNGDITK